MLIANFKIYVKAKKTLDFFCRCVIIIVGMVEVVPRLSRRFITMAYKISDECIGCGACVDGCPVGAISMDGDKAKVDADACIDCGACNGTCPVGAPTQE